MLSQVAVGNGPTAQPPNPPGSLASVSFKNPSSTRGLGRVAAPLGSRSREPAGSEAKFAAYTVGTRTMLCALMFLAHCATDCAPASSATVWAGPQSNIGGVFSCCTVNVASPETVWNPGT